MPNDDFDYFNETNQDAEMKSQPTFKEQDMQKEYKMLNKLKVTFLSPEPSYYDGMFATKFESCIKDKFIGLDTINQMPANYV